MVTFLLVAMTMIGSTLANRNCKAIYTSTPYDDIALFPLDICLPYHDNGIDSSSTLTCNATGHKVIRKFESSQSCQGAFDEEFYDVGDSVECTGNDCQYGVLRRYNSYQCTNIYEDFVDLPVVMGDCVQMDSNAWAQYECNRTVIKVVQYTNSRCQGNQGIIGDIFIGGTCENHGSRYDEIPYCATQPTKEPTQSPVTASPTTETLPPTLSTTSPSRNPTSVTVSPTTAEPTSPTVSPTKMPTSQTSAPTVQTKTPTLTPVHDTISRDDSSTVVIFVNICMVIGIVAMGL